MRTDAVMQIFGKLITCVSSTQDFVRDIIEYNKEGFVELTADQISAALCIDGLRRITRVACPPSPGSGHLAIRAAEQRCLLEFAEHAPLLCIVPEPCDAAGDPAGPSILGRHAQRGWRVGVVPPGSAAMVRLLNLLFLCSFDAPDDAQNREHFQSILNHFSDKPIFSLAVMADRLAVEVCRAHEVEAVWWCMVTHGLLRCSMDEQLTQDTLCSLDPSFQPLSKPPTLIFRPGEFWRDPEAVGRVIAIQRAISDLLQGAPASLSEATATPVVRPGATWLPGHHLPDVPVPMRWDRATSTRLPVSSRALVGATLDPDFACPLQRDLMSRLAFDHDANFEVPTVRIPYVDASGNARHFTPELLVNLGGTGLLCCVPNPAFPESCADLDLKRVAGQAYCERHDLGFDALDFDVFDVARIRTPRLANVQFLWPRWEKDACRLLMYFARILLRFYDHDVGTKAQFLEWTSHPSYDRQDTELAFWTLVADKVLLCDLDRPLTDDTVYRLAEPERRRMYRVTPPYVGYFSNFEWEELSRWMQSRRVSYRLDMDAPV